MAITSAGSRLEFSDVLPSLTEAEEAWLKHQLKQVAVRAGEEFPDPDETATAANCDWHGPRFLRDCPGYKPGSDVLGFSSAFFDRGADSARCLWVFGCDDETSDPQQVAWLVRKFLKQFRPDGFWILSYARTHETAQIGEFGGGAIYVTADEIKVQDSDDFAAECIATRAAARQAQKQAAELLESLLSAYLEDDLTEVLDELAHDTAAQAVADGANNQGQLSQLQYLLKIGWTVKEIEKEVEKAFTL